MHTIRMMDTKIFKKSFTWFLGQLFHRNLHKVKHPTLLVCFTLTEKLPLSQSLSCLSLTLSYLKNSRNIHPFLYIICSLYIKLHASVPLSLTESQKQRNQISHVISLEPLSPKLFLWTTKISQWTFWFNYIVTQTFSQ